MENIRLNDCCESITIIDQTLLPGEERYVELSEPEELYEAISSLRVRGAPAIGIFAAYSMAVLANSLARPKAIRSCCGSAIDSDEGFLREMIEYGEYLKSSRPTAVNLGWAVDRVLGAARTQIHKVRVENPHRINANAGHRTLAEVIRQEAVKIHEEDKAMCRAIAEFGLEEIRCLKSRREHTQPFGILTHCNAGPLATSQYGTALGPLILGQEEGESLRVFADETRPLLQGARLTAYELQKAGVDVTLICDNMASIVMKNGWVQAVFVGCDRIAANGDVANKIGTSGVAVLARHYGIPFYVLGPSSTIDSSCPDGDHIPIEEREADEIGVKYYEKPMAPEGVKCYNPAFDVTDHSLIDGIITEKGISRPPYSF